VVGEEIPLGFGLLDCHVALPDEFLFVEVVDVLACFDFLVHLRLGELGRVDLVMTQASVANDVHYDVFVEFGSVLHGGLESLLDFDGLLRVNVDNGGVDALRQGGRVVAVSVFGGLGGEAYLVVHDDVDGAAGRVVLEVAHLEDFLVDALAAERGVAVDDDGEVFVAHGHFEVLVDDIHLLACADEALDHRVDGVQMAWVRQAHHCQVALGSAADSAEPLVLLDVSGFTLVVKFILDVFTCELP